MVEIQQKRNCSVFAKRKSHKTLREREELKCLVTTQCVFILRRGYSARRSITLETKVEGIFEVVLFA